MRGTDGMQESLFMLAKLEDFVPADHPLRPMRLLVNEALERLTGLFNEIYADTGRAGIAPEKLMRALLLQVFYSIRSERQVCEQLRYNLLFRWFVGVAIDDAVWDHSVFSKNRDRLLEHAVVEAFFAEVMRAADAKGLLSKEHFSVDGTLIQAGASHKSFRPKDGSDDQTPSGPGRNAQADWKGKTRSNDTHESSTDPDARLFRKSHNAASILCYQGHVLMENRSGLVVSAVVTHADGMGERAAALAMLDVMPGKHPKTVAGGQSLRHERFHREMQGAQCHCARGVQPHAARRKRNRWTHDAASRLRSEPDDPQAHRGALRLGQDRGSHPANGLPRIEKGRSALQAHDDGEQHSQNCPNADRGTARSGEMSGNQSGIDLCGNTPTSQSLADHPSSAFALSSSIGSVVMFGRISTAC